MAPNKGSKPPEINSWGWVENVTPDKIGLPELMKVYRITDFKICEEPRRSCKRNPFCYWGLGEKKWVYGEDDGEEDEDSGLREEGEFAGLQNLGATCYVNSLLQLWYHNPILRPAILSWKPSVQNKDSYKPNGPVAQLQAMFARLKVSKRSKIDPTEFVKSLKLDTGEQQDAQEFSKLFMEVIMKKLAEYDDPAVRDSVTSAFSGELQYETQCTECNNTTARPESFLELELNVRKNLQESLDELLIPEVLSGAEQYFCSVCGKKNDANRRLRLLKVPPVLNLQLMRFVFDKQTFRKKKVTTTIQFPEVLDMTDKVSPRSDDNGSISGDGDERPKFVYHLTAVLIHNGPSASSGHYVAQVKDLKNGTWHKFNDENVNPIGRKSQKLILKDDEENGSGSDTEKGKTKKTKASGNHTSQGAYMLVYTLEQYIKEPKPDPGLPPYLEQLIKAEDETYEEELKRTKTDKEMENTQREHRKQEIAMLYPMLELNKQEENGIDDKPHEVENGCSDDDKPQRKRRRSEAVNGNSDGKSENVKKEQQSGMNGNSTQDRPNTRRRLRSGSVSSNSNSRNTSTSSGPTSKRQRKLSKSEAPVKQEKEKEKNPDDYEFIATDWLKQWLDPSNLPAPMDNSVIICAHNKLAPPSPTSGSCHYKAVPRAFAETLDDHHGHDTIRLKGSDAFCLECVRFHCRKLRGLQELEDDFKMFTEMNKRLDNLQNDSSNDSDLEMSETPCYWMSKASIKCWKRLARSEVEKSGKEQNLMNGDPHQEQDDVVAGPLNSELRCPHGDLVPETDGPPRKLIPEKSWVIIKKYLADAVPLAASEVSECDCCKKAKLGKDEQKNSMKEKAMIEKQHLSELYGLKNRPDRQKPGRFFLLNTGFFEGWRRFLKDPMKVEPVKKVRNQELLCVHGLFKYPFDKLDTLYSLTEMSESEDDMFVLLYEEEWDTIKNLYSFDKPIEVLISISQDSKELKFEYTPASCEDCSDQWWKETYHSRFIYSNKSIHVLKREKGNTENNDNQKSPAATEQTSDKEEDLEDLSTEKSLPPKRERKQRDPMNWMNNSLASALTKEPARTMRPRRQRGDKTYKVSSTMTLKELKSMIAKDFCVFISDQHLFIGDIEIEGDQKTLQELEILPDSTLFLEVDTESRDIEEEKPQQIEMGFLGTALMGDERDALLESLEGNEESE